MNPLNDPTIAYLRALLGVRLDEARDETDKGASAIEWAIITALLAGIAIAIGAVILTKIRDKANSINTG
ncbi:hypothetical protein [Spirillospora sp. NPDC047279]|uniref:Flp family type IVb pilin n=1 Tax=Spirillospora sp. NPDC047279 TaxID=3155478 RepID=UPI0033E456CC